MTNEQDLCAITQAVFQKRQMEYSALLKSEHRLRDALSDLRASRAETQSGDRDLAREMTGVDLAWQSWLDQQEKQLLIELAQLRARREPVMYQLRRAFGRDQAAQAILEAANADRAEQRQKKREWD